MSPPAVPSSSGDAVGFDASPVKTVSAPKKPNAYNDSAEEWRKNVRCDSWPNAQLLAGRCDLALQYIARAPMRRRTRHIQPL